ncbi:GntR family transcriptional regulator [Paenibacillus flagellatus]|uniref:GntR family transcriptional regulator n=2 Tax=Paenibacillus flagellatus TaxID=2211139 RepID=A0A2V5K062_9BACL|nr:GntR family transcriptional regulator [Paenibacillus flagellatus]
MIERLGAAIRNGDYAPGDYLPSEKVLAEQFRLSNKSVRKALDALVEEGLIVKLDRVGSRVTDTAAQAATAEITIGFSASIERDFAFSALLDDFRTLHPAVRVKAIPVQSSSNYTGSVREYADNGLIDAFTLNNLDFQLFCETGFVHRLAAFPPDPSLYRTAQEAFVFEGAVYARPVVFSPIVLAYNRAHFREAGVPEPDGGWTWDDAIRHAAALTKPGERHGLYFYLLSDNRWPAFLLQSGMRFAAVGDEPLRLAGSRMMDTIRLCKRIISDPDVFPNYLSENSDDVTELFAQGKVSMIMTNYMTINEFKSTGLDYDISPLPYLFEPRSLVNVIGVAAAAGAKHPEAARLLADYFASPRAQRMIRERTLSLPAHKETAESPAVPDDPMNRPRRYYLFREIMASYRLHRELGLTSPALAGLRQLLKKYWSGLIGEPELCEQVDELLRQER